MPSRPVRNDTAPFLPARNVFFSCSRLASLARSESDGGRTTCPTLPQKRTRYRMAFADRADRVRRGAAPQRQCWDGPRPMTAVARGMRPPAVSRTSRPCMVAAGSPRSGETTIFARGADGAIWSADRGCRRARGIGWAAIPGNGLTSAPSRRATRARGSGVYARGADGSLMETGSNIDHGRSAGHLGQELLPGVVAPWKSIGGRLDRAPNAACVGLRSRTVVVRGADGIIWQRTFDDWPNGWDAWAPLGGSRTRRPCGLDQCTGVPLPAQRRGLRRPGLADLHDLPERSRTANQSVVDSPAASAESPMGAGVSYFAWDPGRASRTVGTWPRGLSAQARLGGRAPGSAAELASTASQLPILPSSPASDRAAGLSRQGRTTPSGTPSRTSARAARRAGHRSGATSSASGRPTVRHHFKTDAQFRRGSRGCAGPGGPDPSHRRAQCLLGWTTVSIWEVWSLFAFLSSRFSLIDFPAAFFVIDCSRGLVTHGRTPSSGARTTPWAGRYARPGRWAGPEWAVADGTRLPGPRGDSMCAGPPAKGQAACST